MSAYSKGYHWEREAKSALENLGLTVFRSAGSHEADLIVPKFIFEVKFRQKLPKTLLEAASRPLTSLSGFIATSLDSLTSPPLLPPKLVPSIPLENLTPKNGILLLRARSAPWIIITKPHILEELKKEVIQCAKLRKTS